MMNNEDDLVAAVCITPCIPATLDWPTCLPFSSTIAVPFTISSIRVNDILLQFAAAVAIHGMSTPNRCSRGARCTTRPKPQANEHAEPTANAYAVAIDSTDCSELDRLA